MIYDLIIIGGGPAGAAASVYAARKKLKTLLMVPEWGGQSIVSEQIYNWIGTASISGADLAKNLKNHVLANTGSDLEVAEGAKVTKLEKSGENFMVTTEDGKQHETKTVLIASGSGRRKLEAIGADRLEHRGITYCASCDGPMFSDQDVVIVGGGNAAFESASQLLAYCKSVTLLNRSHHFRADPVTIDKLSAHPNFKIIKNIDILEVTGTDFAEGIKIKDKESGVETTLNVTGVFVEIGQIPNTGYAKDLVPLDELNRIKIDHKTGKTETPGIWAAGDCTDVLYHQNNIAAGDAVRALENLYLYIHAK
ncbi:MAG: FAD-dependent oxidoreductase [Candidatus Pacebacteria bacterium]|nr:FAD-dependent oxidoreductase [Candidatus Paceibacterota bacterium]